MKHGIFFNSIVLHENNPYNDFHVTTHVIEIINQY